jgi:hypothetical protein
VNVVFGASAASIRVLIVAAGVCARVRFSLLSAAAREHI